tara:strand:+ start:515 stop:1243 length:729 start_codon:yes stop_codon:yes gene_type:complete
MAYSSTSRVRLLSGTQTSETVSGANISNDKILTRQNFESVVSITKNGTALSTPADFSITLPRTINLVASPSASDEYHVTTNILFTDSEIEAFQEEADAVIDAYLGQYYVVPFSQSGSPAAYPALVQMLSASLSSERVLNALYASTGRKEQSSLAIQYKNTALDIVKNLADGIMILPGVTSLKSNSIVVSTAGKKKVFETRNDLGETWHALVDVHKRELDRDYGNGDYYTQLPIIEVVGGSSS